MSGCLSLKTWLRPPSVVIAPSKHSAQATRLSQAGVALDVALPDVALDVVLAGVALDVALPDVALDAALTDVALTEATPAKSAAQKLEISRAPARSRPRTYALI